MVLMSETISADSLRNQVCLYMSQRISEYEDLGIDGINADQPERRYTSMANRIQDMSKSTTQAGEFELVALSKCVNREIIVRTNGGDRHFGQSENKLFLKFTSFGNNSGHYEAVIEE